MQAEAGQSLHRILHRKELERIAGDGLFFWGVGNALGDRLSMLVRLVRAPKVAFSVMKSKPKREDTEPERLLMWNAYVDALGQPRELPDHVLLLSRGTTQNGDKKRHYALVCQSAVPLGLGNWGVLDAQHLRNLGSPSERLGASQVTAIVQHTSAVDSAGNTTYQLAMLADFVAPYFVRLADPIALPVQLARTIDALLDRQPHADTWSEFVGNLRRHARTIASRETSGSHKSLELFH
ncbi:MAG: hypothetical protein ACHQ9S_14260 [Candidatus Binatia bacterium]